MVAESVDHGIPYWPEVTQQKAFREGYPDWHHDQETTVGVGQRQIPGLIDGLVKAVGGGKGVRSWPSSASTTLRAKLS